MSKSDFVWTFPCYILADNVESNAEEMRLASGSRIVAPRVTGADPHIAIFTDLDLAENFREQVPAAFQKGCIEVSGPLQLKSLIGSLSGSFRHAVIDPNPQTGVCRRFLIEEMLAAADDWISELNGE